LGISNGLFSVRDCSILLFPIQELTSTSAEAASRIYNAALRTRTTESEQKLLPTTVWDSFFLHALLRDAEKREFSLSVPHNGPNLDRLNTALKKRNEWIVGTHQDLWAHACFGCMKIVGNGNSAYILQSFDAYVWSHP
jgi:hypothetical protein